MELIWLWIFAKHMIWKEEGIISQRTIIFWNWKKKTFHHLCPEVLWKKIYFWFYKRLQRSLLGKGNQRNIFNDGLFKVAKLDLLLAWILIEFRQKLFEIVVVANQWHKYLKSKTCKYWNEIWNISSFDEVKKDSCKEYKH